jgi:ribose transport system substrate-binding protein
MSTTQFTPRGPTRHGLTRRDFNRAALGALAGAAMPAAYAQAKPWRVAFANISDEIPFGATVMRGFKESAGKRKDMQFTFLDNRNDAARAVDNARTIAAASYDLFIQYNTHAATNVVIGKMMDEAKIKVLAIQIPVPNAPLFAVDNAASGTESGRVLAEAGKARWKDETPVAVIIGLPEAGPLFLERANAAKAEIGKVYPGIAFNEFSSKNDAANARQIATDMLTRNPNRKVLFWVHVDAIALAALAAVRNAGREAECLVSTTGGDRAAFPEIRRANSSFLGTYAFFPELWAEDVLPLAERILRGEPVPPRTFPKRQLFLTSKNIDQYYAS